MYRPPKLMARRQRRPPELSARTRLATDKRNCDARPRAGPQVGTPVDKAINVVCWRRDEVEIGDLKRDSVRGPVKIAMLSRGKSRSEAAIT